MSRALILLLLVSGSVAAARDFRVCVDANDWPPYTYPDHDGTLQVLVRMAALAQGDRVSFTALPWRRCEVDVERGLLDAILGVPSAGLAPFAYPRAGGQPDPARSIATTDLVLMRRADSAVTWDGRSLAGLKQGVVFVQGYEEIRSRLAELGIPATEDYHNDEQNVKAIIAGRASVMATYADEAQRLLVDPRFKGKIEILLPPLGRYDYYLAFAPATYAQAGRDIETLWDAMVRIRDTADYRDAINDMPH
jgi:polar amino acid transport system substrate-binding protein